MASFISTLANKIYSQLPQNEHTVKASTLESQVQGLTNALSDATTEIFKDKISETKNKLNSEKESCLSSLIRLNGEFFQDPKSSLKKAWDTVVTTVQEALQSKIECRQELQTAATQLDSKPKDETIEKAKSAIDIYTRLEKKRNVVEARLNGIISTEKADPIAAPSENALRQRQKELCGNYYQDPNSLLDKAWKEYQKALSENNASASDRLKAYSLLENERKSNILILERLNSIAPALPDRTIEALTTQSIQDEIASLNVEKTNEAALAGVDWRKTAVAATKVSALAVGYLATNIAISNT